MPDALRVAGIPLLIIEDSYIREADETAGETIRMFAGNLGSTERTPKAAFRAQALLTLAEDATLTVALADPGNQVTVASDIDGSSFTGNVRVIRRQPFEHIQAGALAYYLLVDLAIREV